MSGAMRFFRLVAGSPLSIKSTKVQGTNLVLTYE